MVARLPKPAVVTAGVVFGIGVEWVFYDPSEGLAAAGADLAVGCILIVCGVIAWDRRPESRVGLLVALGGLTWFLGNVGTPLVYLHRVPLVALLLSYPTGRAFSRLGWGVTAAVLVYAVIGPLARDDVLTLVAYGAVSLAAASLFGRSSGPIRKARGLALGVTVAFTGVLAVGAAGRLVGWRPDAVLWTYDVVIAVGAVVLIVELVKGRWAEAVVTGLVVDLGAAAGAAR